MNFHKIQKYWDSKKNNALREYYNLQKYNFSKFTLQLVLQVLKVNIIERNVVPAIISLCICFNNTLKLSLLSMNNYNVINNTLVKSTVLQDYMIIRILKDVLAVYY